MPDHTSLPTDLTDDNPTNIDLTPEDLEAMQRIYPDMPCYVANDEEFRAAVEVGLADIRAGRTVPFETVAADLRRRFGQT